MTETQTALERVKTVLAHGIPDRVPLNFFAGWNPEVRAKVENRFGSVAAFSEMLHIDIFTGVVPNFPWTKSAKNTIDLNELYRAPLINPLSDEIVETSADAELFLTVREAVEQYSGKKAVLAHVWGVFELVQFQLGMEEILVNLALEKEKLGRLFMRLAEWSARTVEKAVEAGVDGIELSDDWGQNNVLLFNPKDWWNLIFPAEKLIVEAAKSANLPILLHSDGDITQVLDGIVEMGVDALHPVQESAGMDLKLMKEKYGDKLSIMGGLDTAEALPFKNENEIRKEVERVLGILKPGGGYIFSGSHMIQDDARLEVVEAAYKQAYEMGFYDLDRSKKQEKR
ncbi:methylcobalamin:coenzyme M methyltransferase [bacterium BMS3Abin05]|nr:methylcobalamin:coenzyme M methyltransferase [bacterium BMS3Abin05]GBE28610.1 methylcobalamin:coenzyme M methyltransferase [bacterium BMS3Bbin03]